MNASTQPTSRPRSCSKRPRRPRNARLAALHFSLNDLIETIADEKRKVTVGDKERVMTRRERSFRRMIGRALDGNAHDLAQVIRLMIKYPDVASSVTVQVIIRGALCNV